MTLVLICDFQKYQYNVHETKSANLNKQMGNSGTWYFHQFCDNWCVTNIQLICIIWKAMFNSHTENCVFMHMQIPSF